MVLRATRIEPGVHKTEQNNDVCITMSFWETLLYMEKLAELCEASLPEASWDADGLEKLGL